jgi:hypothetical protein
VSAELGLTGVGVAVELGLAGVGVAVELGLAGVGVAVKLALADRLYNDNGALASPPHGTQQLHERKMGLHISGCSLFLWIRIPY